MKRRHFLKGLALLPLGTVAARSAFAQGAAPATPMPTKLVDPAADPIAKALKYQHDAAKCPERTAERMGVPAKDQNCANCALYVKVGEVDKVEAGKCTMIQSGLVSSKGWCNSWAKKA